MVTRMSFILQYMYSSWAIYEVTGTQCVFLPWPGHIHHVGAKLRPVRNHVTWHMIIWGSRDCLDWCIPTWPMRYGAAWWWYVISSMNNKQGQIEQSQRTNLGQWGKTLVVTCRVFRLHMISGFSELLFDGMTKVYSQCSCHHRMYYCTLWVAVNGL
jgi:hypothetical protein